MLTHSEFISKSINIHGTKYDYSHVLFKNGSTKVQIKCNKCNDIFVQVPYDHLRGHGCRNCVNTKPLTTEIFVNRAIKIHGSMYDYNMVEYKRRNKKVKIKCNTCNCIFEQSPTGHLSGNGCFNCFGKKKSTKEEFIDKANNIHNFKFDYENIDYKNNKTPINILCKKCNTKFMQRPDSHLSGQGCAICSCRHKYTTEEFIKKASIKHKNYYNYSLTKYTGAFDKIKIICPIHGEFDQTASSHLYGDGCPKCPCSVSNPEKDFLNYLKIPNDKNHRQIKLLNKFVDGMNKNKIFEFDGDYWHGNPRLFNLLDTNKRTNTTFDKLYQRTVKKYELLTSKGYQVYHIWESDWDNFKKGTIKTLPLKLYKLGSLTL